MEGNDISKEKEETRAEGGDGSAENTDAHLPVSLPHLVISAVPRRVRVVGCQVDHVIHRETDQNNDGYGLGNSQLPTLELHDADDTHDNRCHTYN